MFTIVVIVSYVLIYILVGIDSLQVTVFLPMYLLLYNRVTVPQGGILLILLQLCSQILYLSNVRLTS